MSQNPSTAPLPDRPPLSTFLSKLIQGGAAWSHQLHPDPYSLPVIATIKRALDLGVRTFDTSPYYHPSELILGKAFADPEISSKYAREDYVLMTKVGRISADKFDYSPDWVKASVERSLERFQTTYLDVVFCHDVEFVKEDEALAAISALWELVVAGKVRYVGISGYPIPALIRISKLAKEEFERPLDVVQSWAQLTLQNTRLLEEGLPAFREAGVDCVCSSSPLAIGLLRSEGVPQGSLGDFHPAPRELREAVSEAAEWVRGQGDDLASLALRFALKEALRERQDAPSVSIISGAGTVEQVEVFVVAMNMVSKEDVSNDAELFEGVRRILGKWVDYTFSGP